VKYSCLVHFAGIGALTRLGVVRECQQSLDSKGTLTKVDEPILAGRLKWTSTFEPRMVMKETKNCLLHNLESPLWAIGCVEIFSSIWMAY
jgi:hypothetical protein